MGREKQNKPRFLWGLSLQMKLTMVFVLTAVLMFVINILLYSEINRSMKKLDEVYATNVSLNALTECLDETHEDVQEYLSTKSSDSLEDYYRNVQEYQDMLEQLNDRIIDNEMKILEKNIRGMSETYLRLADETIQAKRGRNVERYKAAFAEESLKYRYIQYAIYSLNNLQLQNNSDNYQIMFNSLSYMEIISSVIVIAVAVINLLILILLIRTITEPLRVLAKSANEVAAGNFDVSLPEYNRGDEVGVVTQAFAKMIESIREYIDRLRESMEKEQEMKARELLKEAIQHKLAYVTEDRKGDGLILGNPIKINTTLANLEGVSSHMVIDKDKEYAVAVEYKEKLKTKCPTVEQNVGNLSGGNQQKVLLAKWMFADPDVLILDEPTRGIDVGAKYEIYCIINDLVAAGKSVIMISSELPEVLGMSDRIYVMNEGKIAGELTQAEASQEKIMACILNSSKGE